MARAVAQSSTKLSSLIRDPFVRAAFEAAERDGLAPMGAEFGPLPSLDGGEAAALPQELELA